ncbi:DUF2285 domain-containing protein [Aquamicrobium lusatiense]|nr:DUF2285 domain-containing protein [Aquamicrobium lusatiense]MDH4993154.1 DUF2285 domain-containing protein [Aquamicrobium lusatiense]
MSLAAAPALFKVHDARKSPDGIATFYIGDTPTQILLLPGGDQNAPYHALIPLDPSLLDRVEAILRFWRFLDGRKAAPDTRMTLQQRRRFRQMIQAADGRMNGASYREIATAIYGDARVASEPWKTSPLRDSVIGLVKGGLAAIDGGYLSLLRHRRQRNTPRGG